MLPGGLNVRRRAKGLRDGLLAKREQNVSSPTEMIDWVSVYAIAVNEENAAGGRVVTAPTTTITTKIAMIVIVLSDTFGTAIFGHDVPRPAAKEPLLLMHLPRFPADGSSR